MRIKKIAQSLTQLAQVLNTRSESTTDTYSCDYINDIIKTAVIQTVVIGSDYATIDYSSINGTIIGTSIIGWINTQNSALVTVASIINDTSTSINKPSQYYVSDALSGTTYINTLVYYKD